MKIRLPFVAALLILPACTQLAVWPLQEMNNPSSQATSATQSSDAVSSAIPVADSDEMGSSSLSTSLATTEQRVLTGGLLEIGPPSAPLTLIVFTNESCSYCKEFQDTFIPRLVADFAERGELRIVTFHFPLQKYRDSAETAATAICNVLHLHLTPLKLKECVKSPAMRTMLTSQKIIADALGVRVLPTFFLNGEKMTGLPAYADLRGAIEAAASQQ
ncbi:thioredoxin domain-containing protein [Candidatus Peregrinibacteria bacterium]|nr:thioredoxin domain-containing protein [Candidatus Peregrinibacteria bacterium]